MDHLAELRHLADEYIEPLVGDLAGWVFRAAGDGLFEAFGMCPACKGTAYGPGLVDVSLVDKPKALVGEPVDVPCGCHCEFDHGAGRDAGCGRWWIASGIPG